MSADRSPTLSTAVSEPLARDLAEREREVEQAHRRAHLERTPGQFVLTLSESGRILHAIGLDSVLGYAPRAWIGQHVDALLERGGEPDGLLAAIQLDLAQVGRWTAVQRCVRADGTLVTTSLFATPRTDPATHAPAGCYLSGMSMASHASIPGGVPTVPAVPAVPLVAAPPAPERDARRLTPRGVEAVPLQSRPLVLVADDDPAMRSVVRQLLERGGYVVAEAASGRDALSRIREGSMPDYLIADLRMAEGSGGWLVAQVGYEFPRLLSRTLVIAGDAACAAAAHVASRWRCPVLAKPFNGPQLSSTLAALERGTAEVA